MQPSARPTALLVGAVIVAAGATTFGLRSRRTPAGDASTAGDAFQGSLSRSGRVSPSAQEAPSSPGSSGLQMVRGLPLGAAASGDAGPADGIRAVDASAAVTEQLRAALDLPPLTGLGEPGYDPDAAPPGGDSPADEERRAEKAVRASLSGSASGSGSRPGSAPSSEPSPGNAVSLPPPAPTPAGILLSMFKPAERGRLLQHLENGKGLVASCKDSGLANQCMAAGQACARYASCQRWLSGQLASSTRAEAGEVAQGGGELVSGTGAQMSGLDGDPGGGGLDGDPSEGGLAARASGAGGGGGGARGGVRAAVATAKKPADAAPAPSPSATPRTPSTFGVPIEFVPTFPLATPAPTPRPIPRPNPVLDPSERLKPNTKLQLQ